MPKYGFRDYRGGGRSSGRETIGRVASGAIASRILANFRAFLFALIQNPSDRFPSKNLIQKKSTIMPFYMPDADAAARAGAYLEECMKSQDSAGGVDRMPVSAGVPAGLGSPVFEKLDAVLAQAVMSVGAVKAVEIGDGIRSCYI